MSSEFNKAVMFDNISFMLKETGKKIGELESEAGVSPGYIARTSKEGNTKPGIEFIMKAADALKISIDTLLRVDMSSLTPTEKYLISFLEKLTRDTTDDKLEWYRESAGYLNGRLETDINGYCAHPLFSDATFMEESEGDYPEEVSRIVFTSRSFDVHTVIAGDCFNLQMKNETYLYVMNISKSVYKIGDPNAHAKEIWMCPRYGANQFLCNTKGAPEIAMLIEGLYSAISENARHPKVNKDIKEVIDAFMNNEEYDSYSMPEIPF